MKKLASESGQTLIMVALSMTVLLGFAAFATDVGVLLHQRRELQTAADAAALGAATEALAEGNPTSLTTGIWNAAVMDATADGFTPGSSSGAASSSGTALTLTMGTNISTSPFNETGYVQASISQTNATFFMKTFMSLIGNSGYSGTSVAATAIASDTIKSDGCIYVQNGGNAANPAVQMGGHSLIAASTCALSINGSLDMGGSSSISASFIGVSGTIAGTPNVPYAVGIPPQPNPLARLNQTANQPTINTAAKSCTAPTGSGLTCYYDYQGGTLSGTLNPGLYVFDESGGPSISGAVTGSGVTLYLVGNIPFDFSNNGTVNLTPPTSGTFKGILIAAPTDGSNGGGTYTCSSGKGNNSGNPGELYFDFGSSSTTLKGIVYAPYAQLFAQDKGASTSIDTDLVIGNICQQSATLKVNGFSSANSPITKVGLVY